MKAEITKNVSLGIFYPNDNDVLFDRSLEVDHDIPFSTYLMLIGSQVTWLARWVINDRYTYELWINDDPMTEMLLEIPGDYLIAVATVNGLDATSQDYEFWLSVPAG